MPIIQFAKVNPNARIPQKRDEDAGYDLYACFDGPYLLIEPHQTCLVPLGIASAFSKDYVFVVKERGSTGVRGMAQRSGVIDSGFRGEWMLPITNTGEQSLAIVKERERVPAGALSYPYEKAVAQALLLPVPQTEVQEIDYQTLAAIASERGTGMLGSSGK